MQKAAAAAIAEANSHYSPPPAVGTTEWANAYRYLAPGTTNLPGKYRSSVTPYMAGIHAAMDDPDISEIVVRKSAQVAWTDGALLNWLMRRIDLDPAAIIALFPKKEDAQDFVLSKFIPAVKATPRLARIINTNLNSRSGNRQLFWKFPGGFLKLVTSRSTGSVKSTPAPLLLVEEPDDAEKDLKGQGDSIALLRERKKTFGRRGKLIIGGTPTIEGLSTIDFQYRLSDQRLFMVPCHDCGEFHALDFANLQWQQDSPFQHEIYGRNRPDTAFYVCPNCGSPWNDGQKNRQQHRGEWEAQKPFVGVAGFALNELNAPWEGSRFEYLVSEWLKAKYSLEKLGDNTKMIVFVNNKKGLPYAYDTELPQAETLDARSEDYEEGTLPPGVLVVTAGIDVQHDRFAVRIDGWGRGEENWLIRYVELAGAVTDSADPVWQELSDLVFAEFHHPAGFTLRASGIGIDSSDGKTNDNVYKWVRTNKGRRVVALKGDSHNPDREIFTIPRKVDHKSDTKSARYGLRIYMVGTNRAKNVLSQRLKLTGEGPGRMHWYHVGLTFWQGMTAEVKAPSPRRPGVEIWTQKAGQPNEPWDCSAYSLHQARRLRLHVMRPKDWDRLESNLLKRAGKPAEPENRLEVLNEAEKPELGEVVGEVAGEAAASNDQELNQEKSKKTQDSVLLRHMRQHRRGRGRRGRL